MRAERSGNLVEALLWLHSLLLEDTASPSPDASLFSPQPADDATMELESLPSVLGDDAVSVDVLDSAAGVSYTRVVLKFVACALLCAP